MSYKFIVWLPGWYCCFSVYTVHLPVEIFGVDKMVVLPVFLYLTFVLFLHGLCNFACAHL